jgi:2-isopropylmalate synthase
LPILTLKLGYDCGKINSNIAKISEISRKLSGILNEHHNPHLPFAGSSAFAHKGGLHASAVLKNPKLYEHITPESIGNKRKILISNQAGRSNVISMLGDIGITNYTEEHVQKIAHELKKKNLDGCTFEGADASFFIFANKIINQNVEEFYTVLSYKVHVERRYNSHGKLCTFSEGIVKLKFNDGKTFLNVAEGNGPVDAIYNAMHEVLMGINPKIKCLKLNDYKVRIVNSSLGTGAKTLVTIEFMNNQNQYVFTTVGASENIIDASFQALNDGIKYFLILEK